MTEMVRASDVVCRYETADEAKEPVIALDHFSLTIDKGTFVAVLGRNGSGKSTFARCLNALVLPEEGTVLVDGMNTAEEEHLWEIRHRAGMVFQNPDHQIVSAVVEDDVAFGPENLGVPSEEIRRRIDDAMKAVQIYDERHRSPHTLSGGQKQRTAIAGVLAMKPSCVIFDESTAMLDPRGRRDVLDIIRRLREEGITTILITHYMEEAVDADRIIIMKEGRVTADGTPPEIFSRTEEIYEAGLTLPHGVQIRNRLRERGVSIPDNALTIDDLVKAILKESEGRDAD